MHLHEELYQKVHRTNLAQQTKESVLLNGGRISHSQTKLQQTANSYQNFESLYNRWSENGHFFLVMFERAFFTAKCIWKLIQPLKKNLRPLWICALLKIQDGRHNEKSNFQTFCWIFCLNPKNPPKNLVYESKRIMWLSSFL